MENAAKALLIAGGVLLSLLIISILMLMANMLSERARFADELRAREAMVAFNRRVEVFDRQIVSGQEVISAINMALDNNERPEHDEFGPMFINVVIRVNRTFREYTERVRIYEDGRRVVLSPMPHNEIRPLRPGHVYSLMINDYMFNENFRDLFGRSNRPISRIYPGGRDGVPPGATETRTRFTALNDFRNATFYAYHILYSSNGRVYEIRFHQRGVIE